MAYCARDLAGISSACALRARSVLFESLPRFAAVVELPARGDSTRDGPRFYRCGELSAWKLASIASARAKQDQASPSVRGGERSFFDDGRS